VPRSFGEATLPANVSPTTLAARYTTLLARDRAPKAIEVLASYIGDFGETEPAEIAALKGLMADEDGKVAVAAAKGLAMVRAQAAGKLLDIARLLDVRAEDDPSQPRKGGRGVKVVIHRQGIEVSVGDETAEGESVVDRLSLPA
jgi:hypothetical protein